MGNFAGRHGLYQEDWDFLGISSEPTPGTCYDGTFGDGRHGLWEDCLDCNLRMVFVTALPNGLEVLLVVSA